jgi:predicted CoA-binding protein
MTDLHQIATHTRTIALIGASNKPNRPSYGVMKFLLSKGYTVYPVNPTLHGQKIHGQPVYVSLAECPKPIDMVDIFRNTEAAGDVIDEAIALRHSLEIKTIWCQLGVTPLEAAQRAEAAGLTVVMDKCPAIEWR